MSSDLTIIGLAGYAQSGKDTVGRLLVDEHGFTRVAFADALREMAYAMNPIIDTLIKEQDLTRLEPGVEIARHIRLQELVDQQGWEIVKTAYPEVRRLLQALGTEAGRQVLGENIWVDAAWRKVRGSTPEGMRITGRFVFTDVRFPNEARMVGGVGGEVWAIRRPGRSAINAHPSETALDAYPFDRVIENQWDIAYLSEMVRDALAASGLA